MKKLFFAAICFLLFLTVSETRAQDRPFGLGVIFGEPTGISAKLWLSSTTAFDFGFGWSNGGYWNRGHDGRYYDNGRIHFHMDHLWHWFNAIRTSERFPLYTGIGGRVDAGGGYRTAAGVRGVLGIAWMPRRVPIDIFFELAPTLQVVPGTNINIDAALGARFFF